MTSPKNNLHELMHVNDNTDLTVPINSNCNELTTDQNEKDKNRTAWSGKLQFFLSIIGYSIGLGNIWRFPYLCQQNGGGAFLIPYFFMLILEGIPLFLIELGLGQRMRQGSLGVWNKIHPWLGGIGIASCIVTFFVTLYYNVIISWCVFYLFQSFQTVLSWSQCPSNITTGKFINECEKSSSTVYFWYRTTLDITPSIEDMGELKWWIVLSLFFSWFIVYYFMMKGIQSSGTVVYFTSIFPYAVLTIFFIRGITLKGANVGLAHMYTPQVKKLLEPKVWLDAATQVFYSFGSAFGTLIAFGSYNQPNNNCVRDVILVSVCNAFTAVYASTVVFTILGFQAVSNVEKCIQSNRNFLHAYGFLMNISGSEITYQNALDAYKNSSLTLNFTLGECSIKEQLNNAAEGTGLAFIIFTRAILQLPSAPFWSAIFFLMLLSLGLGSQIGLLEGVFCVIFDIEYFKKFKKQYITGITCIFYSLIGLIFCTGAGEYWLELFDSFSSTIGLSVVAFMEMITVAYVYGHDKFTKDIEDMTGYRPGIYWQITWRYLAPIIMACVLCSSIFSMIVKKPQYNAWDSSLGISRPIDYPNWVLVIGIAIIIAGIAPILTIFLFRVFQCVRIDVDIHQSSIRRIDTTVSTKEMIADVDHDECPERVDNYDDDNEQDYEEEDSVLQSIKAISSKNYKNKSFKI